jgi:hypothetical protein
MRLGFELSTRKSQPENIFPEMMTTRVILTNIDPVGIDLLGHLFAAFLACLSHECHEKPKLSRIVLLDFIHRLVSQKTNKIEELKI